MFLNSSIVFLLSTLKLSLNSPLGFAAWLVQELSTLRSTSGRLPKQELTRALHSLERRLTFGFPPSRSTMLKRGSSEHNGESLLSDIVESRPSSAKPNSLALYSLVRRLTIVFFLRASG